MVVFRKATHMISIPREILRRAYQHRRIHLLKLAVLWFLVLSLGAAATWAVHNARGGAVLAVFAGFCAGNLVRGMGSITHDAAHGTVARSRLGVYVIGCLSWLPSFMSFTLYRSYHLDHHRIVNMPHDTDRVQTSRWTNRPILARLLRIVIFTALYPAYWALRVGRHYRVLSAGRKIRVWLELAVGYGALFALRPLMGGDAWALFFVSLVMTSFVLASLTTMAEHFDVDYHHDPAYASRTYATESWLIDWVWGSSTYHVEHHGFPGIPYYNLRRFHREARNFYPRSVTRNVHAGWWSVIFPLLGRLWTLSVREEQARTRRDEETLAPLAGTSCAEAFEHQRGRGCVATFENP